MSEGARAAVDVDLVAVEIEIALELLRDHGERLVDFEQVDVIMGPTAPSTAFKIGEKSNDPVSMYLSDIYTIAVNLAGLPGMSIPAGFADGKPVGLQITGNYFEESRLLNVAHQYQKNTHWHRSIPEDFA